MKNEQEESEKIRKHLSNVLGFEQPTFTKKPTFYYDMYKLGFICSGDKWLPEAQPMENITQKYITNLLKPKDTK